jgi:hypothetical protein
MSPSQLLSRYRPFCEPHDVAIPRFNDVSRLGGWFSRTDAAVFQAVDRAQRRLSITGDLLEIGAFEGRSAVVLGALPRGGETFHICDPFDDRAGVDAANRSENAGHYQGLTRQIFEQNYLRFHPNLPTIHQCLSTELDLAPKSFRLVHIDGSHLYEVVRLDVQLVETLVVESAVVVLDDYRKPDTPGVSAAVWAAVARGLTPLVLTNQKLYASWSPERLTVEALEDALQALGCTTRRVTALSRDAIYASVPPSAAGRIANAVLPRAVVNRLPEHVRSSL